MGHAAIRTARRGTTAVLLTAGIGCALAGCGGSSSHAPSSSPSSSAGGASGSASAGLKLFQSAGCGSCHILGAAHSSGTTGPNLDSLKPSAAQVASQVESGGGAMPSFSGKLSKAQIETLARFVASATRS